MCLMCSWQGRCERVRNIWICDTLDHLRCCVEFLPTLLYVPCQNCGLVMHAESRGIYSSSHAECPREKVMCNYLGWCPTCQLSCYVLEDDQNKFEVRPFNGLYRRKSCFQQDHNLSLAAETYFGPNVTSVGQNVQYYQVKKSI